ncbi:4Fe-4S dicluster domain-containing protein [uncultured Parabacteroides sp.]|jgi:formate hydrogenlyase subunit 6/NADH:ubiquinone oxidoreductase subunit I|uniref:4Fe-4S binding protein n=1 Tax=uncultured Parabacteroides sp. TaxID=512312 RepID=UPI0025993DE6|nr:4Fe-4S dicluster domain-containing protein [uncultured Parabacteroides sp.]
MKNNEGKTISEGDGPKTMWTIDYKKCNVCGECVDACKVRLLKIVDKRIVITSQISCSWCGDCADACASDAIVLT